MSDPLNVSREAVGDLADAAPEVLEWCRQCRDELPHGSTLPPADFILWGKYFPEDAFGPKCYTCAMKWFDVLRVEQYAVFDLRPLRRRVPAVGAEQRAVDAGDAVLILSDAEIDQVADLVSGDREPSSALMKAGLLLTAMAQKDDPAAR
jgi:hypothetical protein